MNKIKLFCFPYAGGSALMYLSWKKYLNNKIELHPVELAGRGRRITEPMYASMEEAIDDILLQIQNKIGNSEYALFGHSMGTILAYELVRKIREHKLNEPVHAFFSGRYPPFIETGTRKHLLTDNEFVKHIVSFGGMTEEMTKNEELMSFVLPIIRSDYRIIEQFKCIEDGFKLNCDITSLGGLSDESVSSENLLRWRECTNKTCTFFKFEGGHFFINDNKEKIAEIINEKLIYSKQYALSSK